MKKKLIAIVLAIGVLIGISGCSVQEQETDSVGNNLKQIREGIERFSKLKNGTLEVDGSMKSVNNAVESMNTGMTKNNSIITFMSNWKGYDFLEETNALNEKTGQYQYSATKQVDGNLFWALPIEQPTKERTKPYEWEDISESNYAQYDPNAALKMMMVPAKLLGNEEYIEAITREKQGTLTKYTLTANDAFAKNVKAFHRAEENYTIFEHLEIYWVNEEGLLIKHQMHDDFEWTIDGIADTYISDVTVELSGCNYKKLKGIGEELLPMIMFEDKIYTQSTALLDVNVDALITIGTIESVIGSVQKPEQNNQANRLIKNATVYKSGKNSIIVKADDYTLYEKSY